MPFTLGTHFLKLKDLIQTNPPPKICPSVPDLSDVDGKNTDHPRAASHISSELCLLELMHCIQFLLLSTVLEMEAGPHACEANYHSPSPSHIFFFSHFSLSPTHPWCVLCVSKCVHTRKCCTHLYMWRSKVSVGNSSASFIETGSQSTPQSTYKAGLAYQLALGMPCLCLRRLQV